MVPSVIVYNYSRRTLSTAESERAVPCTDVTLWVSVARPNDSKTLAATYAGRAAGTERLQTKSANVCLTFFDASNVGILLTVLFIYFRTHIREFSNFNSYNFKINMNENSQKYLQDISFSQLPLVERLTSTIYVMQHLIDLPQSSSNRIRNHTRKFNRVIR